MKHNIEKSVQAVQDLLGIVKIQSEEIGKLRQQIKEQEERYREHEKFNNATCQEMAEIIEENQREIVVLKSLINIPDNVAGMLEELIKTRLYVWESLKNEGLIGWQKTKLTPSGDVWKDSPKPKGRRKQTK